MPNFRKTITVWGVFDLCSIGWFLGWTLFQGEIPFYNDLTKSIESAVAFGIPSLGVIPVFSLLLYASLLFSGFYLIKHQKSGAILAYVQTPFRILMLIPPSIFFIIWPLGYLFKNPHSLLAISTLLLVVFISEALKLFCVIRWRKGEVVA
jgi:hypothetical protein